MLTNAFIGKKEQPTDADLVAALGPAKAAWDRLLSELNEKHGVNRHEWKCYSAKWGWSLHAVRKKRTILWLGPSAGAFTVLFILGAKAMEAARRADLPVRVTRAMAEAPKYPEGFGVRLSVKSLAGLGGRVDLAAVKIAS